MSDTRPLMFVPSLVWTGNCQTLYKVPFHTFGSIKKRHLRLKPCEPNAIDWIDIALVGEASSESQIVKAATPLALIWGDSHNDTVSSASPAKSAFLSSPFSKRVKEENEVLLKDIIEISPGNNTTAFQAFIAKNGRSCIPHPSCCFSIVTHKRSVDLFVSSGGSAQARDTEMAKALVESLRSLLHSYHQRQRDNIGQLQCTLETIRQKDSELKSKELFEAAARGDINRLRYLFNSGMPVDIQDSSGDTVLILACRLGLFDICRLALHEYNAKNDPHPEFGQTALQTAVSSGHAKIVKLVLDTAEPSGADRLISNHEDSNGEAPIHVAARCGSRKIMELLLTHGAELGLVDRRGRTCLHCAALSGHSSCLAFALDFGAEEFLEVKQDNGYTCLHLAIRANSTKCVEILLEAGADVAAETADGSNAYELASKQKNQNIMKLLLEYDVSSRGSGSYSDDSYASSLSGDDIFEGLNLYTVTPAPKNFMPAAQRIESQTPSTYFSAREQQTPVHFPSPGRLTSPHMMSPPMMSYGQMGLHPGMVGGYRYGTPGSYYSAGPAYEYNESQFNYQGDVWTVCYTNDGYAYYYNERTYVSVWDDPRTANAHEQLPEEEPVSLTQTPVKAMPENPADQCKTEHGPIRDQNTPIKAGSPMPEVQNVTRSSGELLMAGSDQRQETGTRTFNATSTLQHTPQMKPNSSPSRNGVLINDKESSPATPSHPSSSNPSSNEPSSNPNKQHQQRSDSRTNINERDVALDPRAALMKMLEKRNPTNGEPVADDTPSKVHKLDHERKDPEPNDDQKAPDDPRAALMDMLKQRNKSLCNDQDKDERKPPHLLAKDPPEQANPDPRAALMAMLKSRNPTPSKDIDSPISAMTTKSPKQPSEITTKVDNGNSDANSTAKTKSLSKDDLLDDPVLKKYMKMTSFGVPPEAVVQKMKQESVDQSKMDIFKDFYGLLPKDPPQKPLEEQQQNIPTKEDLMKDSVLAKYVRMTKVGVPVPAVCIKLTQDKVDPDKVHLFKLAFGVAKRTPKRSPIPPPPKGRRRASTALQKIHWNTVSEERLKNSVWASEANDDSELDASDIEKLESLFASVQTNRAAAAAKKATAKKDTKKKATLIDPKRANNIAISLAQYRSNFSSYDDLVHAVVTLDGQHLNAEKLQNMQLLLPKKEEVARLEQYSGQTLEGLGRAEMFFFAVLKVPRFSQKLSAFIFSLQFEELSSALFSNLHTLSQACQQVVKSKKLAMILRRFLAIGNVMNESAGKKVASGITLDSLIKTAKMKAVDGKTTVLDSVISSRLDLADFKSEMPTVREALRLDLADLASNLKEIETGTKCIELAIKNEQSEVHSSENGHVSDSTLKFLQKLEPFHVHVEKEILNLKASFNHVETNVHSLCSFFAEDSNTKASTIFGVLLEFGQLVERSAEQLRRKEAMEKRRELRSRPNA